MPGADLPALRKSSGFSSIRMAIPVLAGPYAVRRFVPLNVSARPQVFSEQAAAIFTARAGHEI
jgi:hypothetical protein